MILESATNWERSTDIYTLPYVKWIASGKGLDSTETQLSALWCPSGVGWGWRARLEREEAYVYTQLTHLVVQQKLTQHSVQFSHSVMSNSLWPHALQHAWTEHYKAVIAWLKKGNCTFPPWKKKRGGHCWLGLNEDNFACTKLVSFSLKQPLSWLDLSTLELSLPFLAGEMAPSLWQWPFPVGLLPTSTWALDNFMSEKSPPIVLSSDIWGLIVRTTSTNLADLIYSSDLLALRHVTALVSSSLTSLGALGEKRPYLICLYNLEVDVMPTMCVEWMNEYWKLLAI